MKKVLFFAGLFVAVYAILKTLSKTAISSITSMESNFYDASVAYTETDDEDYNV